MSESAAWWRARAACVIARVLESHRRSSPRKLRRALLAAYKKHARSNAPRSTRAIWYEQAHALLGSNIRGMPDRRQLKLPLHPLDRRSPG